MKYILLILGFFFLSANAQAVCSGGFDGSDATFQGCSEMGDVGELIYKRDNDGKVIGKRSDAEIKSYLVSTVEKRLKNRGITMKDQDGNMSIIINDDTVVFDVFNQNGEKVYTYTVDKERGIPANEKDIIAARQSYDVQKAAQREERKSRIARMQALADQIKAEEIDKKAAAK
ncbi:MAG: hypothetical protein IJ752_06365 [Alphaproteobacteria bacterium]|nr:hypothetical protein [Alphaproteobacteria bacterium]